MDDGLWMDDQWDRIRYTAPTRHNEIKHSSVTALARDLERRGSSLKNANVYVIDFPGSQKRPLEMGTLQKRMREERYFQDGIA